MPNPSTASKEGLPPTNAYMSNIECVWGLLQGIENDEVHVRQFLMKFVCGAQLMIFLNDLIYMIFLI